MRTQVKAWGNSQGIRIPGKVLQEININVDDVLDMRVSDGMIILSKPFGHKTLEERSQAYGGELLLDGEYNWGSPEGREAWE